MQKNAQKLTKDNFKNDDFKRCNKGNSEVT